MRKLIAAINMTLDANCDHTAGIADDELHKHYADLLSTVGAVLYGRATYQLMEYWRTVVENPTGNKEIDEFAIIMDKVPKIVFSRTLKNVDWASARLASGGLEEEVLKLKELADAGSKDIYVGSPGLIIALTNLGLIDEYQLCVHPVITSGGLPLFKEINKNITLKLLRTKTLGSGAIVLYYQT